MNEGNASGEVCYRIDGEDRLVFFNDEWDRFASENDTPELAGAIICGRPLWDFIVNAEVRHIHQVLLKRVRLRQPVLSIPFRCDSPAQRRHMQMRIVRLPDNQVEFHCRALRIENRDPVNVDYRTNEDAAALRMCSWCNRVDVGQDAWDEIENAVARLGLFADTSPAPITHTICEHCLALLEQEDNAYA